MNPLAAALCLPLAAPPQDLSGVAGRILAELERVPLVGLAERHRSAAVHELLAALVEHPRFVELVDDVVVECGNALHQPLVDRWMAGADVPDEQLRAVWRDTGQWLVWDSPLYEEFLRRVRARNLARPPERRGRILLGDPPIDWRRVESAAEYREFAERDAFYADVVRSEVLGQDRRALLVVGGMHLLRRGPLGAPPPGGPSVAASLEASDPGALHVVWTLPADAALARQLGIERAPEYVALEGGELGARSWALLAPRDLLVKVGGEWKPIGEKQWPPMREMVDALALGERDTEVAADPALYLDADYQAELRRRAAILAEVYGMDFVSELETLLRDARTATPR